MSTRREFLKRGTSTLALGAAVPNVFGRAIQVDLLDRASARVAPGKMLVIVQLAGGNDGLNTVVPYGDSHYRSLRGGLAVPEPEVLKLDGRLGLHPSLAALKPFWDGRRLAVVEGVGYPEHSQSHFQAMHAWQTASPDGSLNGGWMGRYLDELEEREHHPLHGFNAGSPLSPEMTTGATNVPATDNPDAYGLQLSGDEDSGGERKTAMLKLYESYPASAPHAALLETALDDAVDTAALMKTAVESYTPAAEYPEDSFANGLKLLAALAASEGALRVGHITLGGFDTHSAQPGDHDDLLKTLGDGVAAFLRDMAGHGRGDDVVVMTWSEFGRRAKPNDTDGTDHGTAGPMLLLGGGLRGGIYGEPSPLNNLDDEDNLKVTTDFRRVYATLLEEWLAVDHAPLLGGRFDKLAFL